MKEPIDDERLSALFEGRIVGREREELLAHLVAADEDYEVFADTAEILRALEAEDAGVPEPEVHRVLEPVGAEDEGVLPVAASAREPEVSPVPKEVRAAEGAGTLAEASGILPFRRPEREERRGPSPWMKAAAVIAGIALLSALGLALRGGTPGAAEPLQLAARLDGGLPADWTNDRPWETVRGGGPSRERNARAAQAGAMMVQLAVAARAGDTAQSRVIARQLAARHDDGAAPDTPLRRMADGPTVPPDSLQPLLQQATTRLEDSLERDHLRLGAWVEAARLAARARNQPFFTAGDTQAALDHAEKQTRGDDAARAPLARVRAALPADGPPEWESLEADLKTLLGEIAS
ncbi:MAG TPA: hypothetical protein VEQ60_16835 [Longimicrobium sp.]|nr:hypothetical protein [Longimicrobium sp.]